jgi:hypothetical protein
VTGGVLHRVIVSAATTATADFYDATSGTTAPMFRIPSTSAVSNNELGIPFQNGLRVITTGTIEMSVIFN